jgi:hypothetical protein
MLFRVLYVLYSFEWGRRVGGGGGRWGRGGEGGGGGDRPLTR